MSTDNELKAYLESKGAKHLFFFHYTTIPVLEGMQKCRKLFLTRMDKLNDALEGNADRARRKRIFIASFSFGIAESMAMWSMYGFPYKQGIRLTIPRRAITRTLKDFSDKPTIYSTTNGIKIPISGKATLKMMDVVYAHPGSLEHNRKKLLNNSEQLIKNMTQNPRLACCVKNEVWLSENETRMILELEQELPDDVEKIAIDFGFAVDNLEVTGSPCLSSAGLKKNAEEF